MGNLYARSVFLVSDAHRALDFYVEQLGFSLDWTNQGVDPNDQRLYVFQVSLLGFELILNQTEDPAESGHGRVFIGLENDQGEPFRRHLIAKRIRAHRRDWGRPTLVIDDIDGNELFFWLPHDDFSGIDLFAAS